MTFFGPDLRNGLPIGLGSVAGFGIAPRFSPASLFTGGVNGAWYDPSDSTTLFSDRAGTTPCGTPGQGSVVPVGLMLDKSQGLVLGSELVSGTWANGTAFPFDTFTASGTGFTGNKTAFGISQAVLPAGASIASGAFYRVEVRVTFADDEDITVSFQHASGGGGVASSSSFSFGNVSSATTIVGYVRGTSTGTAYLQMSQQGTNRTLTVASVSVKLIAGNHAIAANDTTARPELRAVVNLLNGSATLATQSVTTVATTYTLYFTGSGSITLSGTATGTYAAGSSSVVCTAGTLTLTVSGTVTTADLRPANSGAQLPVYQARTDANTYDAVGFPRYLVANGTSSAMSTPGNVNLSGTDKATVFAGVRKTGAALGFFAELSANTSSNNGAFYVVANNGTNDYGVSLRGTAQVTYQPVTYTAPISNVLAVSYDIAGAGIADEIVPRVNGVVEQENPSGANAGTGNFGTYPLYIGSRNNASSFLNGNIYSLIVVGSAVSAGQISATEQWVAGKTGITI